MTTTRHLILTDTELLQSSRLCRTFGGFSASGRYQRVTAAGSKLSGQTWCQNVSKMSALD